MKLYTLNKIIELLAKIGTYIIVAAFAYILGGEITPHIIITNDLIFADWVSITLTFAFIWGLSSIGYYVLKDLKILLDERKLNG